MTVAITVAVPVRNEVTHLPRLLDALAAQASAPPFALFLFFDGCSDGGPALAEAAAAASPFEITCATAAELGPSNAGLARRRACAAALARFPHGALLTTDADSAPASDWVATSLAALATADIVAGRIEPDRAACSPGHQRLAAYLDRLHRHRRAIDPVSWEDERSHHWTSAASLAFRPGVYRALDGFAPLPRGEDADLGDRAWRMGWRLRRDARVRVATSMRRGGRAAGGFASLLAMLDGENSGPVVADPRDELWRYRRHALARRCWADGVTGGSARTLGGDVGALTRLAAETVNAEAFTARAVGDPPGGMRTVPLAQAEAALDAIAAMPIAGAA